MKKLLFIIILSTLFLPLLQQNLFFFEETPLEGHFELTVKPELIDSTWFNSKYQNQFDSYFNDYIGFRNNLVRIRNQIQYALFNKVNKETAILGKDDVLFDERYISTFMGDDYIGKTELIKKKNLLETVSLQLKNDSKNLLFVIAPNKARYYEENIPNSYVKGDRTNYEVLINQLEESNVNYIDFNSWFLKEKNHYNVNLIPKYGIHWSNYASGLVEDSIISFCNKNFNYQLPKYIINSTIETNIPKTPDSDIGNALNLLFPFKDEKYLYTNKTVTKGYKKRVLAIGDSFFYNIYDSDFKDNIIDLKGFWYYNKSVKNEGREKYDSDLKTILPETDLVIIMLTEWNLYRLGFGILEEINAYYTGDKLQSNEVKEQIARIKSNKEWLENVKKQAKERGISVDVMLVKAANYTINNRKKKK